MSNYNKQQQAVILKGIAQQILSMNVPTFEEVNKLFQEFGTSVLHSTQPIYVVMTASPQQTDKYIEFPFTDRFYNNTYCAIFYDSASAISFTEMECELYSKSINFSIAVKKQGSTTSCNGRTWTIVTNPEWLVKLRSC